MHAWVWVCETPLKVLQISVLLLYIHSYFVFMSVYVDIIVMEDGSGSMLHVITNLSFCVKPCNRNFMVILLNGHSGLRVIDSI